MRRTLVLLVTATSITLGGAVALAGPAAAGPDNASPNSVWSCEDHPGQHKARGVVNGGGNVGGGVGAERNVGGRCNAPG